MTLRIKALALSLVLITLVVGVPWVVAEGPDLPGASGRDSVVTSLVAKASDDQREALADGQASDEEWLAAANQTMQCLRDAGITVELTPDQGPGQFRFGGGTYEETQRANVIYDGCYARYQREIDMIHALRQSP
ncbi:MAG: hypothetical protein AB7N24_21255 [Dehalococcoidia bacterium]